MSAFSNQSLSRVPPNGLPFPNEVSFEMSDENVMWAEKISLFANDIGMLRKDFRAKVESAPNAEAASFLFDVVYRRLKKKVMQLDALICSGVEVSNDHLLKLQEINDFDEQKEELLRLVSPENLRNPVIKKVFNLA